MSEQTDRAQEIQHTLSTAGWRHIEAIRSSLSNDAREELFELMARKPDTLTGKVALKLAIRSKALSDLKEAIEAELTILIPNRKAGS